MSRVSLVSDVGGTNTRVALARDGKVDPATTVRYRNESHSGLGEIYASYLQDRDVTCDGACIAIAGPVMNGAGRLTNLDWSFDRAQLAQVTGAGTTALLNDLQAQGHAVGFLPADSLAAILPGPEGDAQSTRLVVGVGTGFNAVPVFQTETGRFVPPCESGHTAFPVLTDEDVSLARYVSHHEGFSSVEDVLSGRGLESAYAWASGTDTRLNSTQIMAAMAAGEDPAAQKAVEAFCRALGRVAGDLSLTHLPLGGVYLVGGMATAMLPYLASHGFEDAFRGKGRFSEFMDLFAVWAIQDDFAALTGCARHIDGLMTASR